MKANEPVVSKSRGMLCNCQPHDPARRRHSPAHISIAPNICCAFSCPAVENCGKSEFQNAPHTHARTLPLARKVVAKNIPYPHRLKDFSKVRRVLPAPFHSAFHIPTNERKMLWVIMTQLGYYDWVIMVSKWKRSQVSRAYRMH